MYQLDLALGFERAVLDARRKSLVDGVIANRRAVTASSGRSGGHDQRHGQPARRLKRPSRASTAA